MQYCESTLSIIKPDNSIIHSQVSLNLTGEQFLIKLEAEGQINPYLYDVKIRTGNQLYPLDMTASLQEQHFSQSGSEILLQLKNDSDLQTFGQGQQNKNDSLILTNNLQNSPSKPAAQGLIISGVNEGSILQITQGNFQINPGINQGRDHFLDDLKVLKRKLQEKESEIEDKDKEIIQLQEEIERQQKIIQQSEREKVNAMNQVDSQYKLMDQDHEEEIRKLKSQVQKEKEKNMVLSQQMESLKQGNQKDALVGQSTEQVDNLVKQMKLLENKVNEMGNKKNVDEKIREDRDKQIDKLKYELNEQRLAMKQKDLEIEQKNKIVEFFKNQLDSIQKAMGTFMSPQQVEREQQQLQQKQQEFQWKIEASGHKSADHKGQLN